MMTINEETKTLQKNPLEGQLWYRENGKGAIKHMFLKPDNPSVQFI